jgi:hypothetical protein
VTQQKRPILQITRKETTWKEATDLTATLQKENRTERKKERNRANLKGVTAKGQKEGQAWGWSLIKEQRRKGKNWKPRDIQQGWAGSRPIARDPTVRPVALSTPKDV